MVSFISSSQLLEDTGPSSTVCPEAVGLLRHKCWNHKKGKGLLCDNRKTDYTGIFRYRVLKAVFFLYIMVKQYKICTLNRVFGT